MSDTTEIVAVGRSYTERFRAGSKQTGQGLVVMATVAHEVHEQYGYASYIEWLDTNFGLKRQHGQNLLNVYKLTVTPNFGVDVAPYFTPSALQLLAEPSTPPEVVQRAADAAKSGKPPTHKAVREAIRETKPANGKHVQKVKATRAEPATEPQPEPPVTDATDPQPWKPYNELIREGIELSDQLAAVCDRIRTTPFGGWRDEKADRTFFKNLKNQFEQYRVTGWAHEKQRLTHKGNFTYVMDLPRKAR